MFFFACEVFVAMYSGIPSHLSHLKYLFFGLHGHGHLVPWMWSSLTLMLLGIVLLIIPQLRSNEFLLPVTCAMIIVGTWIDKALGMISGGFVPNPLHQVTEYAPTQQEVLISLGVFSTGFLVLTVLFKLATRVKEEVRG